MKRAAQIQTDVVRKGGMIIWTVCKRPLDFPDKFVARPCLVEANGNPPLQDVLVADTLEQLRAMMPSGLTRMKPNSSDDPIIVELWT